MIIISLIDILIVLLIFLMVTTSFKQFPAVKLTLPESRQPKLLFMHRDQVTTTDSVVSVQGTIYWWRTDDPWSGNMLDDVMLVEGRVKLWDRIIRWNE